MASIFLCTYRKTTAMYTTKWIIYSVLFFLSAASVGIVFKAYSKAGIEDGTNNMMLISAIVMTICYTLLSLFSGRAVTTDNISGNNLSTSKAIFLSLALLSGILSCVYNRLNIHLSGNMDAVIFFPNFNGGVVILSGILSLIIFKEQLSAKQILGLTLGVIAICVLGIF